MAYIKLKDAINEVLTLRDYSMNNEEKVAFSLVYKKLRELPTADVAEVKHGEFAWIADDSPMCTYCGKVFDTNDNADAGITWLFCPNCGAKIGMGTRIQRKSKEEGTERCRER